MGSLGMYDDFGSGSLYRRGSEESLSQPIQCAVCGRWVPYRKAGQSGTGHLVCSAACAWGAENGMIINARKDDENTGLFCPICAGKGHVHDGLCATCGGTGRNQGGLDAELGLT